MKKTIRVLAAFVGVILVSVAFTPPDKPVYKNLKVLPKNITKEEMKVVMDHFKVSLGVKCSFCHVYNQEQKAMDFASDGNKHKEEARAMMRMTQRINKKYFEWSDFTGLQNKLEITCYTCHRGAENPSSWPVIPEEKKE